ncbi:zf-HC2 domain-containing protein [Candidatus Poribacteria bacterium]|nr:zf-HC2 domain-containing protein [Candidatus Poribacteria bacterium]
MEHIEVIAKIPEYIDNDLSLEEYIGVEAHIENCEVCQKRIDEFLAKDTQIPRFTDEEILRLSREGYILSREKERELIQHFQEVIANSLQSSRIDALPLAADEGKKEKQMEEIRRELGLEFARKRLRFSFSEETTYLGRLEIYDIHSAYLVFEKDGQETSDLDKVEIKFYNKDAPEKTLIERVEEDSALLDFSKLNLSIRDYERVGFRFSFSGVSIEGSFAEME